ncbi:MAG TPA: hypothetical protein VMB03_07555 [Bryobacteraceae bacterium]|nr:hypothetical protein [Bryobacteraceae bacterium]
MRHWRAATGIATFESGAPYTVSMGVDTAFRGGTEPTFPDLAGRSTLDDIRLNHFDFGAIKNIPVAERTRLQLRGEFFNAFNHGRFEFAGATLASSISAGPNNRPLIQYLPPENFGRAAARPARVMQVALKLIW